MPASTPTAAQLQQLMAVTQKLALLRRRAELLPAILEAVRPLLPFARIGLFTTDATTGQLTSLLPADSPEALPPDDVHSDGLSGQQLIGAMLLPGSSGALVSGPLRCGGETFGLVCFSAPAGAPYHDADLPLVQLITDQLAVVVASLTITEDLEQRERDKTLLLSISEVLATVHTKQDLHAAVGGPLQSAFRYDDAQLLLVTEDLREGQYLIDLTDPELARRPHYLNAAPFPLTPTQQELFTGLDEPRLVPHPGKPQPTEVCVPLRQQQRLLGVFSMQFREPVAPGRLPLYRDLARQVSLVAANVLAHEREQQQQWAQALQLAVLEALSEQQQAWPERFGRMARAVQPFVPFDFAVFTLAQAGSTTAWRAFRRIGFEEYQTLAPEEFGQVTQLSAARVETLLKPFQEPTARLSTGAAYTAFVADYPLEAQAQRLADLQENVSASVAFDHDRVLSVSLSARRAGSYAPSHREALQALLSSLQLKLEQLCAFEALEVLKDQLKQENTYFRETAAQADSTGVVGRSAPMQQVFEQVQQVAPVDATVLLTGETGTGKELIAQLIHQQSPRRERLLVKVNCAALPANLVESELFGHEKGAFTGALERRIGKFELADGGTLFLDEIGELPLEQQVKLLRAIQEREFERVGSNKLIRTDVRIIAATNRDLEVEVQEGRFRADLYYRLNVFPIQLPPLRQRPDDIPLLAQYFLQKHAKRFGRTFSGFAPAALQAMRAYDWPGNVRELEHVVEHAMILAQSPWVELAKPLVRGRVRPVAEAEPDIKTWKDAERDNILAVLRFTNGRVRGAGGAAELLGLHPNTLDSRMHRLGITREVRTAD